MSGNFRSFDPRALLLVRMIGIFYNLQIMKNFIIQKNARFFDPLLQYFSHSAYEFFFN